ncbi:BTAD domain-containing putative transcriptional regulator [Streptomyces sp. NPDC001393]
MDAGDCRKAARCLREALALRRGAAPVGVQAGRRLEAEIKDPEEMRPRAFDPRIKAELTILVERCPAHEGRHGEASTRLRKLRRSSLLSGSNSSHVSRLNERGFSSTGPAGAILTRCTLAISPGGPHRRSGSSACRSSRW